MPGQKRAQFAGASLRGIAGLVMFALFCFASLAAQAQSCEQIVAAAIASLEEHCGGLARDTVCYAHPAASASLNGGLPITDFAEAGARASALEIARLRTSGLDNDKSQWGIAALHLSANLPRTVDGPGLIMLLGGEAALINEIAPDAAMAIQAPISTAALEEATLYRHPGVIPEPLAEVAAQDLLLVDAYDQTGEWLRVVNDGQVAWLEADKATRLQAMASLPTLGLGATFAWQALTVSTGSEYPECAEAEPWIAIQTPPGMGMSMSINGVDIRLDSMATLQQAHGRALSMTVHRGQATTVFGQTVKQSESVIGVLGKADERDSAILDFSGAIKGSAAEYERGKRAQAALNGLARANGWPEAEAYNYPASVFHVVQPGETLYGLTARYETSVAGIIAANGGDDSLSLVAGMTLIIPKPGSGFAWRSG